MKSSDIKATPFEWRGSNWNPFVEGADATRQTGSGERTWHNVDKDTWVRRKVSPMPMKAKSPSPRLSTGDPGMQAVLRASLAGRAGGALANEQLVVIASDAKETAEAAVTAAKELHNDPIPEKEKAAAEAAKAAHTAAKLLGDATKAVAMGGGGAELEQIAVKIKSARSSANSAAKKAQEERPASPGAANISAKKTAETLEAAKDTLAAVEAVEQSIMESSDPKDVVIIAKAAGAAASAAETVADPSTSNVAAAAAADRASAASDKALVALKEKSSSAASNDNRDRKAAHKAMVAARHATPEEGGWNDFSKIIPAKKRQSPFTPKAFKAALAHRAAAATPLAPWEMAMERRFQGLKHIKTPSAPKAASVFGPELAPHMKLASYMPVGKARCNKGFTKNRKSKMCDPTVPKGIRVPATRRARVPKAPRAARVTKAKLPRCPRYQTRYKGMCLTKDRKKAMMKSDKLMGF